MFKFNFYNINVASSIGGIVILTLIIIFILGVIVGIKYFPQKYIALNDKFQIVCISVLIFSMGISLGKRDNFFKDLFQIGFKSIVLAVIPILCSVMLVYILTKKYIGDKNDNNGNH